VQFLGRLTDEFGSNISISLPQQVKTIIDLKLWLNAEYSSEALSLQSIRAVINDAMVLDHHQIANTDKIAFFPPVGGG